MIKRYFAAPLIICLSLTFTQIQAQVKVNPNGGFENSDVTIGSDTSSVAGWSFELGGTGDASFAIVDDTVHSGNRALAVVIHGAGSNSWDIQAINELFDVNPDKPYTFSVWMKASSAGKSVNITSGNPSFSEFGRSSATIGTSWQQYTFDFSVPAGNLQGRAPIHFSFAQNVGDTIWIDDLSITYPNVYPFIIEAEDGDMGSEWDVQEADGTTYITITTDFDQTSGSASYPGEHRTVSYEITFPDTGIYDLFARVRMPAGGEHENDSFFQPAGFGEKDPQNPEHWHIINGLGEAGFSNASDYVRDAGGLTGGIWKWVNLSRNLYHGDTTRAWIVQDSLARIFQIGAREDGLEIDKFAFGLSSLYFTVGNLEEGTAGATEPLPAPEAPTAPIAEGKVKFLGNIYSNSQLQDFTHYWNQVTPENAGKWGSVALARNFMSWTAVDNAYNLAKDNGFPFRFHVLVWGSQQPTWLDNLRDEEQLEEIRKWFEAVAERYPDIDYLEVVNEPLHAPPSYKEALGGDGETGWDWVIKAFEMAREIFPTTTKLMLNDYNVLGSQTAAYLQIVDLLKERGLIDGIGAQSHHFTMQNIAPATLKSRLDELAKRNLPLQITEYDIAGRTAGSENENDPSFPASVSDAVQLAAYKRTFPVIWEHPAVEGVTIWGWRLGSWRPGRQMHLMNSDGTERPAMEWLRAYVDTAQVTFSVSVENVADGAPQSFRLYHNYPNPFNPVTQIKYEVPVHSDVNIQVYDITGRLIQTLVNQKQAAGTYIVPFNAAGMATGVYFYRLQAGSFTEVKQMMLIK